jgi:hypothetical protein
MYVGVLYLDDILCFITFSPVYFTKITVTYMRHPPPAQSLQIQGGGTNEENGISSFDPQDDTTHGCSRDTV